MKVALQMFKLLFFHIFFAILSLYRSRLWRWFLSFCVNMLQYFMAMEKGKNNNMKRWMNKLNRKTDAFYHQIK